MSRVNAFFLVLIVFSSLCLGATLMQGAIKTPQFSETNNLSQSNTWEFEAECLELISSHKDREKNSLKTQLYSEAFRLGIDGQWRKAKIASECAAHLAYGDHHWRYEAHGLANLN